MRYTKTIQCRDSSCSNTLIITTRTTQQFMWRCQDCIKKAIERNKEKPMNELEKLRQEHEAMGKTIARLEEEAKRKAEEPSNKAQMAAFKDTEPYFAIDSVPQGVYRATPRYAYHAVKAGFKTEKHADAIAFARKIEDLMRVQKGIVVAKDKVDQYVTVISQKSAKPISYNYLDTKLMYFQFGVFDTEENCQRAIDIVGEANLIKAAKAQVGIY